jgi:hypothetical protein
MAGDETTREILQLFRKSGETTTNTVMLIEAVAGWNRDKVIQGLRKHSQIAIKAYGLLPLADDETVLDRYLALKQSAKDGQKFGQQRRATHAAAVRAALANLAQVAGYADAGRLEWAMEAQLAEELAPAGRSWTAGDYEIQLGVDGSEANLVVSRAGRPIKSAPKAVRSSAVYQEAKAAVSQLRAQVSRVKSGLLEGLIVTGEQLAPDELARLMRLPAAHDMFQRLIWGTETGVYGLLDGDVLALRDLAGMSHPITQPVCLAHPYHLFQAGLLADWQRLIVHERIVQPIKQAFRELYVLTPAEQTTHTYSNRFAGQVVDATIAARLFGARGWRIESEPAIPYKIFPGIRAVFAFADVWHFMGGSVPITADRIYFEPYPHRNRWQHQGEDWLPLDQIPPLTFSEVMRDADLVVSVGQREGEAKLSNEAYAQRGSLVTALLDDLGLPGVTVDGHFAYVQGKLAHYRVHLGSAVIHIEPGNYLCIVPQRWGQKHEKLFLPFADENDSKTSEVISKILLLIADDKIKDESILRQIRQRA